MKSFCYIGLPVVEYEKTMQKKFAQNSSSIPYY